MPTDPFDLSDTSDLPEELHRSKPGRKGLAFWDSVFAQASGTFGVHELRAAAFRTDGLVRKTAAVWSTIRVAERNGVIRRVSPGRYEVVKPAKVRAV